MKPLRKIDTKYSYRSYKRQNYRSYCLKRNSRLHIEAKKLNERHWLPKKERVEQRLCITFSNNGI